MISKRKKSIRGINTQGLQNKQIQRSQDQRYRINQQVIQSHNPYFSGYKKNVEFLQNQPSIQSIQQSHPNVTPIYRLPQKIQAQQCQHNVNSTNNLMQSLKKLNIQFGDYIEIKVYGVDFIPIYKVFCGERFEQDRSRYQREVEERRGINNRRLTSFATNKYNDLNQYKDIKTKQFDLRLGSRIFLKYQNFMPYQFSVKKVKKLPYFEGIYMNIQIPGKGFLACTDKKPFDGQKTRQKQYILSYESLEECQKNECMWVCQILSDQQPTDFLSQQYKHQQQSFCIRWINIQTNHYLSLNSQNKLTIDDINSNICSFKITKTNVNPNNYEFIMEKDINVMRRNQQGGRYVGYEEGKRQASARNFSQKVFIRQAQATQITLNNQFVYMKNKLQSRPSLRLIQIILETLMPYSIPQFMETISIVSKYIQNDFYNDKISHLIATYILAYLQKSRQQQLTQVSRLHQVDQINEDQISFHHKSSKSLLIKTPSLNPTSPNPHLIRILQYLNKFCLSSKVNTQVFIPIVDFLFIDPLRYSKEICCLVEDNFGFVKNFYRREWFHKVLRAMLMQKQYKDAWGIQPYLAIIHKFCVMHRFSHVDNQLRLFHTVRQHQFEATQIILNLYVDGCYIFVHQNNKDVQLTTYLQCNQQDSEMLMKRQSLNVKRSSHISQQVRSSNRYSLTKQNSKASNQSYRLSRIVDYMKLLESSCWGCNLAILGKHRQIIRRLLTYCYKPNFPCIKQYQFIRSVLTLSTSFYQPSNELKIFPNYRIGMIDSMQDKYRRMGRVEILTIQNVRRDRIQGLPQKQVVEMTGLFITQCTDYVNMINNKHLTIDQLFQVRAVKGLPIDQYFDFFSMVFSNRLIKLKQKKKAQFMQYLQQLFTNVGFKEKHKNQTSQDNHMNNFITFLLKIVEFDVGYRKYLQHLDIKVNYNYNENLVQNPLINKKTAIKKLKIFNCDQDLTKIQRIKYLQQYFDKGEVLKARNSVIKSQVLTQQKQKQKPSASLFKTFQSPKTTQPMKNLPIPNQSNSKLLQGLERISLIPNPIEPSRIGSTTLMTDYINEQKYLGLKRKALDLMVLVLLNINEEYIQESVQTLNYFIKNPNILNWTAFQLFASIPKYDNQFATRKRVLEQWYLTSDATTFQLLTTLLRMLHSKVSIHLNRINCVQIITDYQMTEIASKIEQDFKQLQRMCKSINSWFKQQLFSSNSLFFKTFEQKLKSVVRMVQQLKNLSECNCVSRDLQVKQILVSLSCFQWIKQILMHISQQLELITHHLKVLPSSKNSSITSYKKVIDQYILQIKILLKLIIEPIDINLLHSEDNYLEEYQENLRYMRVVLFVLAKQIADIQGLHQLIFFIIQIGKTHYDINLIRSLDKHVCFALLNSNQLSFKLFNIFVQFQDYQIYLFSTITYEYLNGLDQVKLNQFISLHCLGQMNKKPDQLKNTQKNVSQNSQSNNNLIDYQNSFYYFIYCLVLMQQKHNSQAQRIPLLQFFFNKILLKTLHQQTQLNESYASILKIYLTMQPPELQKVHNQLTKRKYLCYFIYCLNNPNQKLHSYLGYKSQINQNILIVRQYVMLGLGDTRFYQRLESRKGFKKDIANANFYNTQILAIQRDYLEYFVYDLISLLYLLDHNQLFDHIYQNLKSFYQKLQYFIVGNNIGAIQTHYKHITINTLLKNMQQKKQQPFIKSPRNNFLEQKHYICVNVKNIKFLQHKQIKKMQSTAFRKWKKALKALDQNGLAIQPSLLYQIQHFAQIYSLKDKQSIHMIINNQDLLKKLISVFLNMNLVFKSTQNMIFIAKEVRKFIKSKQFQNLVNIQQSKQILGSKILDQLSQNELSQQKSQTKWQQNTFLICLKLQILKQLSYFNSSATTISISVITQLLKKSHNTFAHDNQLLLLSSNQFKQLNIISQPFYIILQIIYQQLNFQTIQINWLEIIAEQVYYAVIQHLCGQQNGWKSYQQHKANSKVGMHKRILDQLIEKFLKFNLQHLFKKVYNKIKNYSNCDHLEQLLNSHSHFQQPVHIDYYLLDLIFKNNSLASNKGINSLLGINAYNSKNIT